METNWSDLPKRLASRFLRHDGGSVPTGYVATIGAITIAAALFGTTIYKGVERTFGAMGRSLKEIQEQSTANSGQSSVQTVNHPFGPRKPSEDQGHKVTAKF